MRYAVVILRCGILYSRRGDAESFATDFEHKVAWKGQEGSAKAPPILKMEELVDSHSKDQCDYCDDPTNHSTGWYQRNLVQWISRRTSSESFAVAAVNF